MNTQATEPREIYTHTQLRPLFAPQSIALIGASANPTGIPGRALAHLGSFQGAIYPINPKYPELGGQPCYPSIKQLPATPDLAVIALPRESVEGAIHQCIEAGIAAAIVFASGYSETSLAERIADQDRLSRLAQGGGLRLLGPNCMGIMNFQVGAMVSFTTGEIPLRRASGHAIGLVSQSGAVGFSLAQAVERGISFSHIVTAGNSADVDIADEIAYLAEDQDCNAIACVFEGTSDPSRLLQAAQVCESNGKALVVYKIGTGEAGAEAALSHTGSLAGSAEGYKALFRRMNAVVAENLEDLLDVATFFAKAPRPQASGVAIVSASGGLAIDGADKAELHGLPLPQPTQETETRLRQHIPEFGSVRNPCDTTAQVVTRPGSLEACCEAMLLQADIGVVAIPFPTARESLKGRIRLLGEVARKNGKPICVVWTSGWLEGPGASMVEDTEGTTLFRSMDTCMATLAAWNLHASQRVEAALPTRRSAEAAVSGANALLDQAGRSLTEREAKQLLACYGVPVVEEKLVSSATRAADVSCQMGFPVVMKVESPEIPHKTEVGGVRLGITSGQQASEAFDQIIANAIAARPDAEIRGVLIQPMVTAGIEIMVGARIDPALGPLIVVSLGGIMVELLKDSAVDLAPVSMERARQLLESLRGAALLSGFRGGRPVDMDRLCDVICRISEFAHDHGHRLTELDVNPLICSGETIIAVDALIQKAIH